MMQAGFKPVVAGVARPQLAAGSSRGIVATICREGRTMQDIPSIPRLAAVSACKPPALKPLAFASDLWKKSRIALERHGDPIITIANLFQLSGFACSDALQLQSIMILGNGGMALFFITRMPTMKVPFIWAFLKVCVNVFMVFKLTSERQPVKLSTEEFDVYEEHFMPFGITARQFKKFWDLGETQTLSRDTKLVVEGEYNDSVSLVMSGHVFRTAAGQYIPGLDSFPGANKNPDGDAGAWVAEIQALKMIDTIDNADNQISRGLHRRKVDKVLSDSAVSDDLTCDDAKAGNQKLQTLREFKEGFAMELDSQSRIDIDGLLEHSVHRWTVHAGKGVTVRSWKLRPLLSLCQKDPETAGLLRKAFSQSAIMKLLALDSARVAMPRERKATVAGSRPAR
jgi:hypothetical protein